MELPRHFFAVFPDGIHSITIGDDYIGPQTALLDSLAKHAPRVVPGIFTDGSSLAITPTGVSIARCLKSLRIHTFFRPKVDTNEKVTLVPVWVQSPKGSPPAAEMDFEWTPPGGMTLFLILSWECGNNDPAVHEPMVYLIARDDGLKTYLLPLPNLYEDGRMCLGTGVRFSPATALDQFDKVIKRLSTSKWNTDLMRAPEYAEELFQFDPDGKQVGVTRDWKQLCLRTNHSNYQFIAKL